MNFWMRQQSGSNRRKQNDDDEESLPRLVKHAELPPRSWRSWLRRAGAESRTDGQMVEREGWSKHAGNWCTKKVMLT